MTKPTRRQHRDDTRPATLETAFKAAIAKVSSGTDVQRKALGLLTARNNTRAAVVMAREITRTSN